MTEQNKLKAYKIIYKGLYMGGVAIVLANNTQEALDLVEKDTSTINFTNVRVETFAIQPGEILFNDNGDY